mmetsp:Transcript_5420/g.9120  ORF Transcript_5420/g.9120 Transcript_5420/m.9120 type:complete len:121 (-) Transcript_5420:156-518(-)
MDSEVEAVLVGTDPDLTYTNLSLASLYISYGKAKFVCTNEEGSTLFRGDKGEKVVYPGAGASLEAVLLSLNDECGSQETKRPDLVGKPSAFPLEVIKKELGFDNLSQIAVINTMLDHDEE